MALSDEMKQLYRCLYVGLKMDLPAKEKEIMELLANETITSNLEFRVRIVQIIGLIKFLNHLPVYVPEAEQKILDHVRSQSQVKNLNPVMTNSFFKVVIEHSKAVQDRLAKLMKDREEEANAILTGALPLLKDRSSQKTHGHDTPGDKKVLSDRQLSYCRSLIKKTTDNILSEMKNISNRDELNRKLTAINCGLFYTSAVISPHSLPTKRNDKPIPVLANRRQSRL
ncbi:MAG TPA: chorismate mutase [Gammaproteobacteria bacterium]|nr:chorismate mutase [Gammaproteobacteria bacterium]